MSRGKRASGTRRPPEARERGTEHSAGARSARAQRVKTPAVVGCLYRSRRGTLLTLVALICVAMPLLVVYLFAIMYEAERLASYERSAGLTVLQAAIFLLSVAPLAGVVWLSGRYVLRVDRDESGTLHIVTWTLFGPRRRAWPASTVWKRVTAHAGTAHAPGAPAGNPPYLAVHPDGGSRLVIDLQGETPHGADTLEVVFS